MTTAPSLSGLVYPIIYIKIRCKLIIQILLFYNISKSYLNPNFYKDNNKFDF